MRRFAIGMLTLGACAAEPGVGSPVASNVPRISLNSLTPSALAGSQLTSGVLDATSAAAMGQTAEARTALTYAVGCALDATQSISFTVGGATFGADGAMGMAPGWTSDGLSASEAAWVSACVLARVNLTATAVTISARGAATGLETTAGERATFQIEEGAFWGNVFGDRGAVAGTSCDGVDQAADDSYGDLPVRQCAQWDGVPGSTESPCGMHYAGLCVDACAAQGAYTGCSFEGGTPATAVITTFLEGAPE